MEFTSVVLAVAGWAAIAEAYQRRRRAGGRDSWLRTLLDVDKQAWRVTALAAGAIAIVILAGLVEGNYVVLAGLLPLAALLRVAMLRRAGRAVRAW